MRFIIAIVLVGLTLVFPPLIVISLPYMLLCKYGYIGEKWGG